MDNLTTEDGVVNYMSNATSEDDWNRRCNEVKSANNGYPKFWYSAIIASGLLTTVRTNRGW